MTSSLAWLDASPEDQRRVREVIALFSQPGTVDEMGIGQIRDLFSDALFPGTSTLHTRARYFLLVPWTFMQAAEKVKDSAALHKRARNIERDLIETLIRMGGQAGVIGARAGRNVKTLPSDAYWGGLQTLQILQRHVELDRLSAVQHPEERGPDEFSSRTEQDWIPTIPSAPKGFPGRLEHGLDMTLEEAEWLRERILDTVPSTLLAHLVSFDSPPSDKSLYPWSDAISRSAQGAAGRILNHAHLFSFAMLGATRLYHIMLAEQREQPDAKVESDDPEDFRQAFNEWATGREHDLIRGWNTIDFWELVNSKNPRVTQHTKYFVDSWIELIRSQKAEHLPENPKACDLITDREYKTKRNSARLHNKELLKRWSGSSPGLGLTYRWSSVKTLVTDIHEGLNRA